MPAAVVDEAMVESAQQGQVLRRGRATPVAGHEVVKVAPLPGPVAAIETAAAVTDADRSP